MFERSGNQGKSEPHISTDPATLGTWAPVTLAIRLMSFLSTRRTPRTPASQNRLPKTPKLARLQLQEVHEARKRS
jgi:hypothetical protein